MSDEIKLELKKPLDKMTAKELRQLVIDKIPQITGASGMDKETLLSSIKEVMGITDEEGSAGKAYKEQISSLKKKIKDLQAQKLELPKSEKNVRQALRKKIHTLKKRTRRLSAR
jgi:predicted ATPase